MQKAWADDVKKAPIRNLLISVHETRGFEWQTAHTKRWQENRCVKTAKDDLYMHLKAEYDTKNICQK